MGGVHGSRRGYCEINKRELGVDKERDRGVVFGKMVGGSIKSLVGISCVF